MIAKNRVIRVDARIVNSTNLRPRRSTRKSADPTGSAIDDTKRGENVDAVDCERLRSWRRARNSLQISGVQSMKRCNVKSSKKLLTLSDAARRLDVGLSSIDRAIARGDFKPVLFNGIRRIPAAAVDRLLAFDAEESLAAHTSTYSMNEAAKVLGVSRQVLYDAIKRGEIPSSKIGARRIVPRAVVDALVAGEVPRDIARDAKYFRALKEWNQWGTEAGLPTFHFYGVQYRSLDALAQVVSERHRMGLQAVPALPTETETLEATG